MSRENVEVVRRMYDAFHSFDAETALAHFDPDVVFDVSARPDGGTGRGREALSRAIFQWVAAFDDWREEIEELRVAGDLVYVRAVQRGRGKGSGLDIDALYAVVYEVKRGTIVRMTLYADPADALEAVGLSE